MNNETKFTPGPWTVSEYTNYDGWSVFADVIGCVAERWPAYTMSEDQKTEAHANANLIAAAPEMYAALKAIDALFAEPLCCLVRKMHGSITNGDQDVIDAAFGKMMHALEKVEQP